MLAIFNYLALFLACVIGIVVFDDDPTGVSIQEWIFFAVMLYCAVGMIRRFRNLLKDHGEF